MKALGFHPEQEKKEEKEGNLFLARSWTELSRTDPHQKCLYDTLRYLYANERPCTYSPLCVICIYMLSKCNRSCQVPKII